MIAEFITGVVGNLTADGLARILGTSALRRRLAIQRRLDNSAENTKRFRRAIDDVVVLIGREGNYDKTTERFFNELQRSSFPHDVTTALTTGTDFRLPQSIFRDIYSRFDFPSTTSADALFDRLLVAIRANYDLLSSDKELIQLIALRTNNIQNRLKGLTQELSSYQRDSKTISAAELDALRIETCRAYQTTYQYLSVETNKGVRKIGISKLFINPSFRQSPHQEVAKGARKKQASFSFDDQTLYLSDLLTERCVILGDPGGGKSTLVQHIC